MKDYFSKPPEEGNGGYGFSDFISHEDINNNCYVQDDILTLRCIISPLKSDVIIINPFKH